VFWLVLGAAFGHHPEDLDFVLTDGTIELE
jgi:hypothetical protein